MLDRIKIRGVPAGVVGVALLAMAAVVGGPAIARGAEVDSTFSTPMSVAQQEDVMHWKLMNAHYLRHVHRVRHHTETRASRTTTRTPLTGDPRTIAHAMLLRQGGSESDWSCLDALWGRESGWSVYATNASSGAYGIPQALPASKMAAFGADWQTNPITQIEWGLSYIAQTYGSPCAALSHSGAYGYY